MIKLVKPLKFLLSGGLAALAELVIFLSLLELLNMHPVVAQPLSFLTGLLISYSLNRAWVFRTGASSKIEFMKYAVLAVLNLFASTIIVATLIEIGFAAMVAKLIVIGLVALWNYFVYKNFIFVDRSRA
jgi:putative flippase GtrA